MMPVTTVRVILEDNLERILLLKRATGTYMEGTWSLPGGKVDYAESLEEACRKEVREETGLSIYNPAYLFYHENLPAFEGEMHCITHYFTAHYTGTLTINSESCDARWIRPRELSLYPTALDNDVAVRGYLQMKEGETLQKKPTPK